MKPVALEWLYPDGKPYTLTWVGEDAKRVQGGGIKFTSHPLYRSPAPTVGAASGIDKRRCDWFDAFTKDRCDCFFETAQVARWVDEVMAGSDYTPGPGAALSGASPEPTAAVEALRELVDECAPYLKDGETPLQRIERDCADTQALLSLFAVEKRDGRRYRWLRDKSGMLHKSDLRLALGAGDFTSLDAFIDAALAQQPAQPLVDPVVAHPSNTSVHSVERSGVLPDAVNQPSPHACRWPACACEHRVCGG